MQDRIGCGYVDRVGSFVYRCCEMLTARNWDDCYSLLFEVDNQENPLDISPD